MTADLRQEWRDLSSAWVTEARDGRFPTRAGLLDRPMLELCGDLSGKRVLDCGCGEGRFCRLVLERGAGHALGVDLCPPMIEAAMALRTDRDEYRVGDVQDLSFLTDDSFDLAISYLNQCDIPDFAANSREAFRVLKPAGRFIVANIHPMRSAAGGWQKTPDGKKDHVILDRYFDEGPRSWHQLPPDAVELFVRRSRGWLSDRESGRAHRRQRSASNFVIYSLRKPT